MSGIQRAGLVAAAAVIAVAAFVLLKPGDEDGNTERPAARTEPETPQRTTTQEAGPARPAVTRVELRGGRVVGGAKRIEVETGERVRIVVTSDRPDELHLHGYDVTRRVAPGTPARFNLRATAEGEFELEAHDLGHLKVASLVVAPS